MLERVSLESRATRGDCIARARALAPLIAANAARIEQEREIVPEVLAALHEARLFRMLLPRSCDGWEADPVTFMQAIEELAKADGSTAWCVAQASGCSMTAAYVAPAVAREIFGDARAVMAWGPGPAGSNGRAVPVAGGYRASGSWSFASGIKHASWLGCHCAVVEPDGTPRLAADGKPAERTMLIPKASAAVKDVWRVVGLKGTGSDTYTIDDLFVPDAYTYTRESPAERREAGPLYRCTTYHLYGIGFAAIALGLARAALDTFVALAATKVPKAKTSVAARQCGGPGAGRAGRGQARVVARLSSLQTLHEVWATAVARRDVVAGAARHAQARRHLCGAPGQGRGRHRLSRRRRDRDLREQSVRAPLPRRAHRDPAGAVAVRQFRDGGAGAARPAEPVEADLTR